MTKNVGLIYWIFEVILGGKVECLYRVGCCESSLTVYVYIFCVLPFSFLHPAAISRCLHVVFHFCPSEFLRDARFCYFDRPMSRWYWWLYEARQHRHLFFVGEMSSILEFRLFLDFSALEQKYENQVSKIYPSARFFIAEWVFWFTDVQGSIFPTFKSSKTEFRSFRHSPFIFLIHYISIKRIHFLKSRIILLKADWIWI